MRFRKKILGVLISSILVSSVLPVYAEECNGDSIADKTNPSVHAEEDVIEEQVIPASENNQDKVVTDTEVQTMADVSLVSEGKCGDNLTWKFYNDGSLNINGTGEMSQKYDLTGDETWWSGDDVKSVIIEEGIKNISGYAFEKCSNLEKVLISDGVERIEYLAFNDCKKLKEISLPSSLVDIEDFAFLGCESLDSLKLPDQLTYIRQSAFAGCKALTSIEIPNSVKYIDSKAFSGCLSLKMLKIPNSVQNTTDIISGCKNLEEIQVEKGSTAYSSENGVLFNRNKTELLCYPSRKMENRYIIPDTVEYVLSYAFQSNEFLTSIVMSERLDSIGEFAFAECSNLADVIISEKIYSIGASAFAQCKSLTHVTIPSSVKWIGRDVFSYCNNLKEIRMKGDAPEGQTPLAYMCAEDLIIKVPKNAVGYDREPWNQYNLLYIDEITSMVSELKAAAYSKNKVKLTWKALKDADGYLVYAHKNNKYGYCGMTSGTSFTDVKALDTEYNFYWVFPYVKDNSGKIYPGQCTKYVYAKGITAAVKNLKAVSQVGGVKLSWTASIDAEGYLVYGKRARGTYGYIGMTTLGTNFIDKKASKEEYNFYWVFPYHRDNTGKMIAGGTPNYVYGMSK